MDTKFTKGEWYIEDYSSMLDVGTKHNGSVCTVECGYQTSEMLIDPNDEEMANAHLIAAAPDMYKMLDEVNKAIIHCDNEIGLADVITCMCHDIDQLLKKARGE